MSRPALPSFPALLLLAAALSSSCIIYVRADDDDYDVEARSLSSAAFDGPRVRGNGEAATEVREVEAVRRLEVDGAIEVAVEVGGAPGLTISGDSNVLQHVRTECSGETLRVTLARGSYELREPLLVRLSTPALDELSSRGSGDVSVARLAGRDLTVTLLGSGDLALDGDVARLTVDSSGSGDVDATGLSVADAELQLLGSGDIELGSVGELAVELVGSGDVRYTGEPASVRSEVTGSGTVRAH